MNSPATFEALIDSAEGLGLYENLIRQLNKDLRFANIDLEFNVATLPISLKLILKETIHELIHHRFDDYLNLLYRIDVPENEVKQISGRDAQVLTEKVTFLILKREWQKVWYRHRY